MVRRMLKAALFLAFLLGHAWAQSPRTSANVVLITIDTLRADHVGCYGAKDVKTPTLDGLARDGVIFERAISQVPLTWPSHAAILTGTYPFQNGVQDFTGQPLAVQFQTVAQAFKRRGYATGAVVSAFVLDRSWGLGRGFDYYDDAFSAETFQKKDIGLVDRRAEQSVAHALTWLKKTPKRPFFLWLHLYDPHSPYDAPEPFRSQYKEHPYDGEIAYADHHLASLMTWLKQSKLYDSSLIVVLSDHGESLGEHGEQEHGFFIYNSTVHIPLIVKPPVRSGIRLGRINEPVETTSVAPTLMSLAGPSAAQQDPIEKQFQSPPLFKSMNTAASQPDSAYSETFYPFSSFGWNPLHSIQTARYHYIDAPKPELYDLSVDPGETHNIAPEQTASVGVLKDKLQQILKVNPFANTSFGGSVPAQSKLNADAAEKLRALGYMAYHSPVSQEALASGNLGDPKDKLWEFNAILKATDAFQSGNDEQAKTLLAAVREKDPNIYIVPFLLGETALRRKNWDEAATELRRCLELNPNFDQAMAGLARALINGGNGVEARSWLNKALEINPQNYRVWYELGHLESQTGNSAAIRAYEKSIDIQPNFAPVRRDLGMLQFRQRNYPQAAKQLEKAADLGVNEAPLFNFLGISYSRTGRIQKAVASYQRALKLDPDYAEAHLNLGFAYQRLARPVQAKKEYDAACRLDPNLCNLVPNAQAAN